jgi:hypothetical protein
LKELEDTAEYETDQLAVQLVRVQRLTEKIFHFHNRDQMMDELPGIPEVSLTLSLETFQAELTTLYETLSPDLKSDCKSAKAYLRQITVQAVNAVYVIDFLCCHYNSAYLRLFEPLLTGTYPPETESQELASFSISDVSIFDIFSRFTAALKAWFENWLNIPVCSYFYMPQPTLGELINASKMLSHWSIIAGAKAVKLCSTSSMASGRDVTILHRTTPAFNGVPVCPDLSLLQPPASVSVQALNDLRDQVLAQPILQVDIFGILDAMTIRLEAAKKEMAAAQGGIWKNDLWDLAAEHIKMKRIRVEKWCEIVAMMSQEGRNRVNDTYTEEDQGSEEIMNMLGGRSMDDLEWLVSDIGQDNWQWEADLFDEILGDFQIDGHFR